MVRLAFDDSLQLRHLAGRRVGTCFSLSDATYGFFRSEESFWGKCIVSQLWMSSMVNAFGNQLLQRCVSVWALVFAWAGTTLMGMTYLARYEHQAGQSRQAPVTWPRDSEIKPSEDQPTLLIFAHPKCPCTLASFDELERLTADCQGQAEIYVVFVKPPIAGGKAAADTTAWESTSLWRIAKRTTGIKTRLDEGGKEARRFGALTSGQTLLFDAKGELLFQGGITSSRGHSGGNAGRDAIVSWITRGTSEVNRTPVFGCELGTEIEQGLAECCQQ